MRVHVALLRGINVGGHRPVAMADLRDLCARLGLREVRSILQSGNLVFRSPAPRAPRLERLLEAEAERHLGLQTDFFVRTAEEWDAVVAGNPFREEAKRDPSHLIVVFLKAAPKAAGVEALRAAVTGPEVVHVRGAQAYLVYPRGIGRSRVTTGLIEEKLATRATGRSWNTVLKLAALASG